MNIIQIKQLLISLGALHKPFLWATVVLEDFPLLLPHQSLMVKELGTLIQYINPIKWGSLRMKLVWALVMGSFNVPTAQDDAKATVLGWTIFEFILVKNHLAVQSKVVVTDSNKKVKNIPTCEIDTELIRVLFWILKKVESLLAHPSIWFMELVIMKGSRSCSEMRRILLYEYPWVEGHLCSSKVLKMVRIYPSKTWLMVLRMRCRRQRQRQRLF